MITEISWKNVWRNRVRSSVVIAAFTLGIFGSLFTIATMFGMFETRIEKAIGNETSHIQIHNPDFLENNELQYTINNYQQLVDSILLLPEVEAVSPRIKILGMASTSGNATGVMINGINPDRERILSGIDETIIGDMGTYFEGDGKKSIVVGEKLARDLKLIYYELQVEDLLEMKESKKLGSVSEDLDSLRDIRYRTEAEFDDALLQTLGQSMADKYAYFIKKEATKYRLRKKIVLSFQSLDGHIVYDAFRVTGIYRTSNSMFDGLNVFVLNSDVAPAANLNDNQVNEIAIRLGSSNTDDLTATYIRTLVPELSVETWKEIMPEARMYTEMMDALLMIFMVIILLALGFGIVNTMLMAVLERIKELGMLMAIGMNKTRVFIMIMLETIFLGLTGSVFGMILSYLVILYTGHKGIDLSRLYQEGFNAMGFDSVMFPSLGFESFVQVTLLVILTGVIASIYPARKAIKLKPAEAIRIDM